MDYPSDSDPYLKNAANMNDEAELPELRIRAGTPDKLAEDLPELYETTDLFIKMTDDEELGREAWDPRIPTLWYDVYTKDGHFIADCGVDYDYESKTISIDTVQIYGEDNRGKGYGVQLYTAIIDQLRLPDGRTPEEAGFVFMTDGSHSPEAEHVWQSLERRGLAQNVGGRAYVVEPTLPSVAGTDSRAPM